MNEFFDLNIEKVLEHWEVKHAIREIIANALDEQYLSGTKDIDIFQEGNRWHIRDYGRGIQSIHFTQNENKEKIESPSLIGKFGVGLKDALAVFYRKNILVEINSKHAHITTQMAEKAGFGISTLHAVFSEPYDRNMEGTEFVITGVKKSDIDDAKSMFLHFAQYNTPLESTKYGEVFRRSGDSANIYINGVLVATEENFAFSYNITNISAQIKKALNRERSNVGRTAYADSVKNILKSCSSENVLMPLVEDIDNVVRGTNHDESGWVDVASHAVKELNKNNKVVFMTPNERASLTNQQVEILKNSGKNLVLIPDSVFGKVSGSINTFKNIYNEYQTGFTYKFVDEDRLTSSEKDVFALKDVVVSFFATTFKKPTIKNATIKISETIRVDQEGCETDGVWDPEENAVIIKRKTLSSKAKFCGVLAHELTHYYSGCPDNSRDFENELTSIIGCLLTTTDGGFSVKSASVKKKRFFR